MKYTNIQTII